MIPFWSLGCGGLQVRTIVVESTACPVMLVGGDAGAENEM